MFFEAYDDMSNAEATFFGYDEQVGLWRLWRTSHGGDRVAPSKVPIRSRFKSNYLSLSTVLCAESEE